MIEVGIEGLKPLNRALKQVGGDVPKMTRLAFNEAAQNIVGPVKRRVVSRSGRAKKSVRATSTRTKARVSGGNARAPYYGWLDFGGRVGEFKQVVRPYKADGRYLYVEYFKQRDSGTIADSMSEQLNDVIRKAGLEVTDG